MLFVGSAVWEGGYGPPLRTPQITEAIASGKLKIAVVDPRFSKLASKAWRWVPARNGSEGALALALIRWILEHERYDKPFLAAANRAAAKARGESTWTNATWLVKCVEKNGKLTPGAFLYGSEVGMPKLVKTLTRSREVPEVDAAGQPMLDDKGRPKLVKVTEPVLGEDGKPVTYELDPPLVLRGGELVPVDPGDEDVAVEGELFGERPLTVTGKDGQPVQVVAKTALTLLRESAGERTLAEWAEICGIEPATIEELAREFASHGKRSVADIHAGVSQHTNGYYNVHAFYSLNLLVGNFDHRGGMMKAAAWAIDGSKPGQPYNLGKLHPAKLSPFGISTIRHGIKFEETTLFDPAKGKANYPARRQWWPLSSDVYEEVIPSIGDAYPYPTRALFTYMAAPTYALPGGQTNIKILLDLERVPLFVACDIAIGETSMYADYIFPDLSYLERWEFHGSHPTVAWKVQSVRQPVIGPIPEAVRVFGQEMPLSLEAMLMGLAERMALPGFGKDGFAPGQDFTHPDQFYLRAVANLAAGEKPVVEVGGAPVWPGAVPDASDEEVELFLRARRHLPPSVFDPERWRAATGEALWRKAVWVLNRGGRLDEFEKGWEGELLKNRYGKQANLYCEKTARAKSAITGHSYHGIARYVPISGLDERPIDDGAAGFDLHLMTYREIMQTKSRTISNYYLNALRPENFLLMNRADATARGLRGGDKVRVSSASNPEGVWDLGPAGRRSIVGTLKVIAGIRPGVVAFSLGHGHWAMGASDFELDGRRVAGDPRRATGIHANAAMRLDPAMPNTCLLDPVGGSVSFYDTKVKVERA